MVVYRRYAVFGLVLLADVLAQATTSALKAAIDRDRPPARWGQPEPLVDTPHTHSFPSGHAASSFACATVLAAAFPRLRVPLFVLAALIAWSRVYIGVHFPLDVLAGALIGVGIGLAVPRALPVAGRVVRRR